MENGKRKQILTFFFLFFSFSRFFFTQPLGAYKTPAEAAQAFDHAAMEAKRPISHFNFPHLLPKSFERRGKRSTAKRVLTVKKRIFFITFILF